MTYSETFDIPASANAVFDALLDEKVLRQWLAQHVRVEPHKGGAFHFWGSDVIWSDSAEATHGEILELDRPHTLAFSWLWKGYYSRISLRVTEIETGSRLAVEHAFESFDPGSQGPGPDMAGCHWRIAVGNLISVLTQGSAALRPDYSADYSADSADYTDYTDYTANNTSDDSATAGETVELEIEIAAPPADVFRALLDPERVRAWMQVDAPSIDADAGQYSYGWHRGDPPVAVGPSRILELIPDRLLVHDWQWTDEPEGQIRWELSPNGAGTRLRFTHINSRERTHVLGWSDALVSIKRLIEGAAL